MTKLILNITLAICFALGFSACSSTYDSKIVTAKKGESVMVKGKRALYLGIQRVTFYTSHEKDGYGSRVAAPGVKRAKEGVCVAAHSSYPFFKQLYIPELKGVKGDNLLTILDRGGALQRRKASRGACDVFDVYLDGSNRHMKEMAKLNPPYLDVYVLE